MDAVTIPAGQASGNGTLAFTPQDDEIDGEDWMVEVTGFAEGFTVIPAPFTITDDDDPPTGVTLTVSPATINEGAGVTTLTVTGTLTGGDLPGVDIEVPLSIVGLSLPPADPNGTATIAASAADFTADTPTLTILAGKPSATASLELTPVDDNLAEGNETAHVTGSGDLTVTPALLTIADNDQDPDGIRLSSNPTSVSEGDGPTSVEITAALVGGAARTAATAVELSVHEISAAATDYSTGSAVTLTIPAGQMSAPATLT